MSYSNGIYINLAFDWDQTGAVKNSKPTILEYAVHFCPGRRGVLAIHMLKNISYVHAHVSNSQILSRWRVLHFFVSPVKIIIGQQVGSLPPP